MFLLSIFTRMVRFSLSNGLGTHLMVVVFRILCSFSTSRLFVAFLLFTVRIRVYVTGAYKTYVALFIFVISLQIATALAALGAYVENKCMNGIFRNFLQNGYCTCMHTIVLSLVTLRDTPCSRDNEQ